MPGSLAVVVLELHEVGRQQIHLARQEHDALLCPTLLSMICWISTVLVRGETGGGLTNKFRYLKSRTDLSVEALPSSRNAPTRAIRTAAHECRGAAPHGIATGALRVSQANGRTALDYREDVEAVRQRPSPCYVISSCYLSFLGIYREHHSSISVDRGQYVLHLTERRGRRTMGCNAGDDAVDAKNLCGICCRPEAAKERWPGPQSESIQIAYGKNLIGWATAEISDAAGRSAAPNLRRTFPFE